MKDVTKADFKLYFYLYLMTLPFTWLIVKITHMGYKTDEIVLNIFIALSIWLYIKKVRPFLNIEGNKTNILLFFLIATLIFLSIHTTSNISNMESDISHIESNITGIESNISNIESNVSMIETSLDYR